MSSPADDEGEAVDRELVRDAWSEGLRPEPAILVSEWADRYRQLPQKSSAEPGAWRTSRTPYLRAIMDDLSSSSPCSEVVFMKCAQIGGTEGILNAIGYYVDHAPGPAMIVQPTVELAKRFSRQRLDPLFATPRLKPKLGRDGGKQGKGRDADNSMLSKEFLGGVLIITGANSAVGLRSMPARYLLLDEVDGYPADVDEEGDPIALAEARQRTFARRKTIKVSTPTIAGASAIERAYEASDQRRYYVPCPFCGHPQTLRFERLTWTKLGLEPGGAVYLCESCERPIENHHKTEMLARGEWLSKAHARELGLSPDGKPPEAAASSSAEPVEGEQPAPAAELESDVYGYHLNALYSPVGWLSWGDIAEAFVASYKSPEKLRVFTNTILGETWSERGEAPEWQKLYDRRAVYSIGTVPADGLLITAGADVGKDRIIYEVVAWGRGKRSWSIDAGTIPGDTADLESPASPWPSLRAVLERTFRHDSGVDLSIRMLAVDSGWNTQTVYTWCRSFPLSRVIAVKGIEAGGVLIGTPGTVDINMRGRRPMRGYKVWPVCGAVAKSEFYGWLRLEPVEDGGSPPALVLPPGWCEFPEYDAEFFKQLTAEHLVMKKNKRGYVRLEWSVIPGRENHALDARVYARAAAGLVGLDRFAESDWLSLERVVARRPGNPDNTPTPAPRPAPGRRPGGWLGGRRGGWLK